MPSIQIKISPLADSHVVRWKGLKGYAQKQDAISELLELVDIDALLKEKSNPPALPSQIAYSGRLDGGGRTSSEPDPQKTTSALPKTRQRARPAQEKGYLKEAKK